MVLSFIQIMNICVFFLLWSTTTGGSKFSSYSTEKARQYYQYENFIIIKSNVIMKRINFNQRPTLVTRGSSSATCENSTKRMWELVSIVSVPSGFSDLIVLGVYCSSSVSSRAFVMRSPLELVIMPPLRDDFSHLRPLPAARLGCPVPLVVEG